MKKFSFLIYHQDYKPFLEELRELGLVHVVENKLNQEKNQSLDLFYSEFRKLNEAKKLLSKWVDKKNPVPQNTADIQIGQTLPKKIETIEEEQTELQQKLQIVKKEKETLLPWGDFKPENISQLKEAGYHIDFFSAQDSAYKTEWEKKFNAIVIAQKGARKYFITIAKDKDVSNQIMIDAIKMPETSISQLEQLIKNLESQIEAKKEEMRNLTADLPSLSLAIEELEQNIEFEKVKVSADKVADEKVMYLQGWAPVANEKDICDYLEQKNAYYKISDPQPEDDVPIKFKNTKFNSFFEPIAEIYMLPKYNEIDLTPYFAPFYMIFFGLSLGDIGYGLFLFVAATVAKILMKQKLQAPMKGILSLVQVLGVSAMLTGLLTGGFFGANIYHIDLPFIKTLEKNVLLDNNQMFSLSLILGVVQILFGMCLKVANRVKQFGFIYGISTIGWIVFLVSFIVSYFFKEQMPMFGTLHLFFLIPSMIAIYFLNSPGKNPLLNLGLGLWDTYNMATGLLGDVLSYVRLFALGLSGGILASVFNSLAAGMSPDNAIFGPIVYLLIFVLGHAITIFMNTLGAIVHPVRLTFVEFYKNADFEGGGQKYSPFSRKLK